MLPTGLCYDPVGRVVRDPDRQVQEVFRTFFATFRRVGSAQGTVKEFRRQGIGFPRRRSAGPNAGTLIWGQLTRSLALQTLHNPRYAGAFCHGRTRCRLGADGRKFSTTLPRDQWQVLIKARHEGYIDWEQYEENQRQLRQNANAHGEDRRRGPAREGPALLQGLVICGLCGQRMTVRYHKRHRRQIPDYLCQNTSIEQGTTRCQELPGASIDKAIGELLLDMVSPLNLQVAISVQTEVESRLEEADQLRRQQVERARYEADLARRRFMQVDPDNRLVADALERDWNNRLRQLAEAQADYEQRRDADQRLLSDEQRRKIAALARDFPRLWQDPATSCRDRKRVVRLLIEDVTLIRDQGITLHIRFKGGATRTVKLPPLLCAWEKYTTDPAVVARIDALIEDHTDAQTAQILNGEGLHSGRGQAFTAESVRVVRRAYALRSRRQRLLERGLLPPAAVASLIGTKRGAVGRWRRRGALKAEKLNDNRQYLYEPPDAHVLAAIRQRQKHRPPGAASAPAQVRA
jgi:hypothetical protein